MRRSTSSSQALPVITNQKMNNHLKNLCELCGIATSTKSDAMAKIAASWEEERVLNFDNFTRMRA